IIAGFVGVPAALGGGNAIEHFLAPSFHAEASHAPSEPSHAAEAAREGAHEGDEAHMSRMGEIGLMAFSVLVAVLGIALAYRLYARSPETADQLAERFAGAHRTLLNKYYVDELYGATVIAGTWSAARSLWTFDKTVVDGAVNGAGWATLVGAWFSGLNDKTIV